MVASMREAIEGRRRRSDDRPVRKIRRLADEDWRSEISFWFSTICLYAKLPSD